MIKEGLINKQPFRTPPTTKRPEPPKAQTPSRFVGIHSCFDKCYGSYYTPLKYRTIPVYW
jgi:hypothetical protein